ARPALRALQIDEVTHGAQMCGILGEGCGHGSLECRSPMGVEQIDEPAGQAPQVRTTLGGKLEEARSTGGGVMDAIDGPMCAAGALVINQGLDMRRSFDLRTAIKAARVHGNDGIGIEDTHRLESREQLQAAAHPLSPSGPPTSNAPAPLTA